MRSLLVIAFLIAVALAGCTTNNTASPIVAMDNACVELGVCFVEEDDPRMEEVDWQPNAVPLISFHQDQVGSVNAMVRTDDGWAIGLRDASGRSHVIVIDELNLEGRRYPIPNGDAVIEQGLLVAEDMLHITSATPGSTTGPTIHSWNLETDQVQSLTFPDMPAAARPKGAYDDSLLIVAPRGLLAGDSAVWVLEGEDMFGIGAGGRVMDGAMVTGLLYLVVEQDGLWRIELQSVDGSFQLVAWTSEATIGGIWGNDGHVAFNQIIDTSDPAGGRLWEIDHRTHNVSRMGNGWDVKFSGNQVIHLTRSEGTSPFVTEWSRTLQQPSEGVFLPDQPIWDATDEGLWWLEAPRTDHRFVETPNPTPFTTMLMTSDR